MQIRKMKTNRNTTINTIIAGVFILSSHFAFSQENVVTNGKNATTVHTNTPESKLTELGIVLPKTSPPTNSYLPSVSTQGMIYLSGKGPRKDDGSYITGKLGKDLITSQGYEAARNIAIGQLTELKATLGDLSKVKRIVKVTGFVNSTADFQEQSKVLDGFSDLMVEIFGEQGKHARTSVGVASLPFNMAVEVEVIVETQP